MAKLRYIVLICALLAGYYCQDNFPPEPKSRTTASSHRTSEPGTPTPSTTTSTSTTAKPTTAPLTTTVNPTTPSTTTVKPTTASTTTVKPTTASTTTEIPTTPTTASPTSTTVKPTPDPGNPAVGNWTVPYSNSNKSCIVIDVAVQFEVAKLVNNKTIKINLPPNATAKGACDKDNEWLILSWGSNNTLRFDFSKVDSGKFELKNITSTLILTLSDNVTKSYELVHKNAEFSTPLSKSYKCAKVQTLNLTELTSNKTLCYLHISHTQFQAFGNVSGHTFESALDCEGSITPDIVPIVVGCVLAALVILVLIAYLVGRRRCQARGYLSMFRYHRIDNDGNEVPMRRLFCFEL